MFRRRWLLVQLFLIASAILMIGFSIYLGQASLYLFLIFPVVTGSGWLLLLGVFILIFSLLLPLFLLPSGFPGSTNSDYENTLPPSAEKERLFRGGAVIFIGPIPIIIAEDKRFALYLLLISVALLFLLIFFLPFIL